METYPCHDGHITIDAENYLCGKKYKYIGIVTRKNVNAFSPNFREKSTVLKWKTVDKVKCEKCRELQIEIEKNKKIEEERLSEELYIKALKKQKNNENSQ